MPIPGQIQDRALSPTRGRCRPRDSLSENYSDPRVWQIPGNQKNNYESSLKIKIVPNLDIWNSHRLTSAYKLILKNDVQENKSLHEIDTKTKNKQWADAPKILKF